MRAIDLFAGWGGFSLGATQADVDVVWAANHWPLAVEAHAANHPQTQHVCQDLRQADWTQLPKFDLLMAAPACQGHSHAARPSRARSDKTRRYHDALRATAWAVVDCADVTDPAAIIVENVPDFLRWRLYPVWKQALEALGYHLAEYKLVASHFGVPQRRERLFIVGTRDPIFALQPPMKAEPGFGPCVDWDDGNWRSIDRASVGARARIDAARERHGDRCLIQHVTGHRGISLNEPIRTITTKDQWAVIDGDRYRPLTIREHARGMGFPDHYGWPPGSTRRDAIRGLGNAVCPPVARELIRQVKEAI